MSNLMAPGPPDQGGSEEEEEPKGPSHEQIAALAYKYWLERGMQHGKDLEDWLKAEEDLSMEGEEK